MDVEFFVKISVGKRRSHIVDDVVYYRRYMSLEFVMRWQWYFHYISALVQVRHPELFVRTFIARTDMLTPAEYIEKKRADLIRAQKAKLTKIKGIPVQYDLFGYNQTERVEKVEAIEKRLKDLTAKCCKGCAFEHSDGDCPSMVCKYIQWKNDVGVIFRKVEKDGKTE